MFDQGACETGFAQTEYDRIIELLFDHF